MIEFSNNLSRIENGVYFSMQWDMRDTFRHEKINTSTPALVLKLEHYGSLGIVRSLGKLGVDVYGMDYKKINPASCSRYCKNNFVWNIESPDENKSVDFLISTAKKIKRKAVLIPTSDETALFVLRHENILRDLYSFPGASYNLVKKLCSKKEMFHLARQYNIPVPKSYFPDSINHLKYISETATFPLLLKGIDGSKLEKKVGRKMIIVNNPVQLIKYYQQIEDKCEPNIMIQEYIPETKDHMWIFNGYFNSQSECIAAFTGRKLRQNPVYTGMTSLGTCQWNEILIEISRIFMKATGYQGAVDIDYVYDVRDCRYKILDVNPRVGASFRLFVGSNNIDTIRAMYLDLTGQQVPFSKPADGRKWLVEDKDLLSSYFYFKDGVLKFDEWIKSLSGIKETGYFSISDPLPSMFVGAYHIKRSFGRLMKKIIGKVSGRDNRDSHGKSADAYTFESSKKLILKEFEQRKSVRDYYDHNDNWLGKIYTSSSDPHALGVRRRKKYILHMLDRHFDFKKARASAIDIGCGPGAYMIELSMRGCSVYGIDISTEMLRSCKRNLETLNDQEKLLCADAGHLPFNHRVFNIVICVGVLQYVLSIEKVLEEINRITARGAMVAICVENMLSVSNIGYYLKSKLQRRFFRKQSNESEDSDTGIGIISQWFLKYVNVPHLYRLKLLPISLLRNTTLYPGVI